MKRISRLLRLSYIPLLMLLASCMVTSSHAQISITPSGNCVVRGNTVVYSIAGQWGGSTNMKWCVTGGIITNNNSTCVQGTPYPTIAVTWNGSGSSGSIILTTSVGNSSRTITIANALNAGDFTSGSTQQLPYNTVPAPIICSPSTGGSCGSLTYSYQWYQRTTGSWSPIPGATGVNLGFSGGLTETTHYYRRTSTSIGSAETYTASIYITGPIVAGNLSPASQHVFDNETAGILTSTQASGGSCSGNFLYWWQWADNINGPYTTINAPPGLSFQPPVMSSTKYFRQQVVCMPGGTEIGYSDPIVVHVYPVFTVGDLYTVSGYTAVTFNNGPGPITGSVSGGMCNGNYEYQWLQSTDNVNYTEIAGATGASYTPVNLTQSTWFRRRVTCNGLVKYSSIQITVHAQLSITPSSTCVIRGSTQTYSVAPYAATTSMQWCVTGGVITYNNSNCVLGTPYPSATILWNGTGSSGTINVTTSIGNLTQNITIADPLTAGQFTSGNNQQISYNRIPAPIICSPSTGGGCGTVAYSYQWYQKVGSGSWLPIAGATGTNLSFSSGLTQSTQYFRRTNGSVDTYTASINVSAQLTGGKLSPASQHVFNNEAADTLKGTPASGGLCAASGSYLYWWQWADNINGPFTTINIVPPGLWMKPPVLSATKYFRRQVICQPGATDTAYSDTVVVYVHPAFAVGELSAGATTIAYNTSPGAITGTVIGGSCNGNYQYQWQQSTDNNTYTDITGATTASYNPGNLINNTWFRRKVTCNEVTAHSTIYITVMPPLQAGLIRAPVLNVLVNTDPGTITGTAASGGNCGGVYSYQWQQSVNAGITWNDISNATGADHSPGNQTATISYRRRTVCGSETGYTNALTFVVHNSSPETVNRNYIRTRTINKPQLTDEGLGYGLTSVNDVLQSTDYYDGLGRLVQQVSKQQGAGTVARDMVQPMEYDPYGRELKKYMPYASAGTDGNFKPDPLTEQQSYLGDQFPGEFSFYTQTKYEAAPNGRALKTTAPGASFTGSNRGVELRYETNAANEVQIWGVIYPNGYVITGAYPAGALHKQVTINEDGKQVIEYKDKEDKIILRKIQAANQPSNDHTGWLCTYYVYDNYGNLVLVAQPKAVEWIVQHGNWNTLFDPLPLYEFCFEYKYDRLNRLVGKRSPGAQWQYLVYDRWDRVILTQDAALRKTNKWIFTKYDGHDRPIITGFYTDNTHLTQADMQAWADNSITTLSRFEIRDDTKPNGYTTDRSFPVLSTPEYLSVAWFDNYSWCAGQGVNSSKDNSFDSKLPAASNTVYPYVQPLMQSSRVRGLQTGIKYYLVNGSGHANISVHFYDDNGRIIQTQNKHIAGGTDILTTQYDFSGKAIATHLRHQKGSPNTQVHEVITLNTYNHAGQITKVEKRLISPIANTKAQQTIATYAYNDLGSRKSKKLGLHTDPVETQDYDYNVRGWMTGINKDFVSGANTTKYFGLELGYDKPFTEIPGANFQHLRFNGNVSGAIWRSKGDGIARKYDYLYDNPNRLIRADFTQNTGGLTWTNSAVDFSVYGAPEHGNNIGYDANGNILSLYQNAFTLTTSRPIDKLNYAYLNNGESNKLLAVTEDGSIGATRHKLGDFTDLNRSADDYTYDDNGNLITDKNKRIAIAYNHLNLPRLITFTDSTGAIRGTIEYVYDAGGNKLIKKVNETGRPARSIQYIGSAQYDNDTLQLIAHEEGRIRYIKPEAGAAGNYEFDYFLQDNLGNTRMVLTEEEQTDPYTLLSYEGTAGSVPVQQQDIQYENRTGNSIDVVTNRTAWPAAYKTYNPTATGETNDYAMLVQKSTGAIGAAKLLKVMAGDRIHTRVDYWYDVVNTNNSGADARQSIVTSLLAALGISNKPTDLVKEASGAITSALNNDGALLSFLNAPPAASGANQAPKAYLNVVFFNEQFQFDQASSRIFPVEYISDHVKRSFNKFMADAIRAEKSGYAYVYFSNESNEPVYFDNFQITHERGRILEETHYYPFGGRLEALCSQAYGKLPNKFQFGGKELQSDEFDPASDPDGLQWLDFGARLYDPQIGRWHTPDPMADEMRRWSPYNYAYNNPVRFTDPDGMWPNDASYDEGIPKWAQHLTNYALSQIHVDGVPRMIGTENMSEQLAQQWINYWINNYANSPLIPYLKGVDDFFRTAPEIAASFLPGVDAYNSAKEGDYAMAGVYLVIDVAGGSLEKGAAKLTMKVAEKFAVKQIEKQVMQETLHLTSHSIADDIVENVVRHEQYALLASDDGLYPIMQWGFDEPVGWIELQKGEVWKYGTTLDPFGRYPQKFLDNTGSGLYYNPEFTGTLDEVLEMEARKIINYLWANGGLPPGNKMIK